MSWRGVNATVDGGLHEALSLLVSVILPRALHLVYNHGHLLS